MKLPKITPGPWSPILESGKHAVIGAESKKPVRCICVLANHSSPIELEVFSNAQAIASAPDLIEALIGLIDTCRIFNISGPDVDQAIAALLKAGCTE